MIRKQSFKNDLEKKLPCKVRVIKYKIGLQKNAGRSNEILISDHCNGSWPSISFTLFILIRKIKCYVQLKK